MISLNSLYDSAKAKIDARVLRADVRLVLEKLGGDELLAKQIAARCGMTASKARTLLAGMAESGLIAHRPHPTMKRHPRPSLWRKA